jgi:PAS domain S-box-containing protein
MSIKASATNSDRRFRVLIEHSSEVIALLTPEGTVSCANPSIERVLGYSPQEFMAINVFAVIHPGDIAFIARTFQQLLAVPGMVDTQQFRCRHKDGTWRWVEATMTNLLHDPDVQALVMNLRDITERKQAEEEELRALAQWKKERLVESTERKHIEESEQRFRLLADGAPVMIWTSGIDKLCTYFNASWLSFTGRTIEQELGNGWAEGVYPADKQRCLDIYTSSFDARKPFSMDYRLRRFDGQYRWILDNGIPFYAPDGTFTGYIGSCIDITERRSLEQRKQEFLRMVSHELETPLTAILGLIELALLHINHRPKSLAPEAEGLLKQIEQKLSLACGQVVIETRLVGDLLEMSQLEMHQFTLSLRHENLVTIVQKTVAGHQAAHTRDIELDLPPVEVVPVIADGDRIGQVLTNYLTNAFKFSPADEVIAVLLEMKSSSVRVAVRDQGPGLTPEQQQRVWEQFYQVAAPGQQRPERGLGLGSAIAKAIIEQHHGQVGVESASGQGATFWFTLPLADGSIRA